MSQSQRRYSAPAPATAASEDIRAQRAVSQYERSSSRPERTRSWNDFRTRYSLDANMTHLEPTETPPLYPQRARRPLPLRPLPHTPTTASPSPRQSYYWSDSTASTSPLLTPSPPSSSSSASYYSPTFELEEKPRPLPRAPPAQIIIPPPSVLVCLASPREDQTATDDVDWELLDEILSRYMMESPMEEIPRSGFSHCKTRLFEDLVVPPEDQLAGFP